MYHDIIDTVFYQNITAAPGEAVDFLVMAIDQAGNPQEATWSVMQKNENENEEEEPTSDVS